MLFLLFVLLLFFYPALCLQPATTINHINSATKGRRYHNISELKRYMQRFGYLPISDTNSTATADNDDQLTVALTRYQRKLGLRVTGKPDPETISQMNLPRCGVHDTSHPNNLHADYNAIQHYNYFNGKPRWSRAIPTTLTYAFSPNYVNSNLNLHDIKVTFRRAFSRWSAVIPVNFTETVDYGFSDIKIGFYSGDHDDGQPFDGVLGVLAHGFSPESGKLHLDAAETWAVDFDTEKSTVAIDLESVATHEIGHVLGLAHSFVKESVMYPSLKPRDNKMDLTVDDIKGIQKLYGSNPDFNIEAFSQSDYTSLNEAVSNMREGNILAMVITMVLIMCV